MPVLIFRWLINALALFGLSRILPGIELGGVFAALLVAAVLGVLNAVIRPVLILLTLPLTLITLGLFIFVVNALVILLAAWLLPGDVFLVTSFWWAVLLAVCLSAVSWLTNWVLQPGTEGGGVRIRVSRRVRPKDDDIHDLRQGPNGRWE
ncbi:MAG: phage holin family protein [Proteobacteria bacterium]|nr:phage holin family protein [Pseudomonadota bacterium]